MQPLVSINLVVHNRGPWLQRALDSIRLQTYPNIEVNEFDGTADNIGFWAGQEKLLPRSNGTYIICMSDVVLDKDFVRNALEAMERDPTIGALQAKVLQLSTISPYGRILDTTGFQIFRSRRVINRGKEEADRDQYSEGDIFAVEGAVPVFRKSALENLPYLVDPDFRIGPYGYGDDLDLAWRLRNAGWKQWYAPSVIAYHDRSTRGPRSQIPLIKRQLDWCNVRLTILKNDRWRDLFRDAPFWILREIGVILYTLIFEPRVLGIVPRFFKLAPRMIRRREHYRASSL